MLMPEFLGSHDHPRKALQGRGKYKWDEWLVPGQHIMFHKHSGEWGPADFPDATAANFRQAGYNAASKRGISISATLIGDDMVEMWVHE
jgi:hypothetical protein